MKNIKYKALIVGLGSIGKRHVSILKEKHNVQIYRYLTANSKNDEEYVNKHGIINIANIDDVKNIKPDFALICTPSSKHTHYAYSLAKKRIPLLIEKPLCIELNELEKKLVNIVLNKKIPVLVGFHMRHHPGYKMVKKVIDEGGIGKPYHFRGVVGQYLPDWRPSQNYKESYSAKKEFGGGAIFDLCHEIDLSLALMGRAKTVFGLKNKVTNLKINTEDVADIILSHENGGISNIHLNYIDSKYTWYTHILGEKGSLSWDYAAGTVKIFAGNKEKIIKVADRKNRDVAFINQIDHWMKVWKKKRKPCVSIYDGMNVSEIAIRAHESSEKLQIISI